MKIFLFVYLMSLLSFQCYSQNCLALYQTQYDSLINIENYYDVKIDTCMNSSSFGQFFIKKGIIVRMTDYIFKLRPILLMYPFRINHTKMA